MSQKTPLPKPITIRGRKLTVEETQRVLVLERAMHFASLRGLMNYHDVACFTQPVRETAFPISTERDAAA